MISPTPEQRKQWERDGLLVLEDALVGEELHRLQTDFDHWHEACKEDWLNCVAAGEVAPTFYDIPDPLQKDELFVDLIDHPSWYGLLQDFTGGELILLGPQFRAVPPWPVSYTRWHPDVPQSNPLHIKVQIYVNDVPSDCGEFAYVPGSHKPDAGPYTTPTRGESMPGHRLLPGKAGTAIVFNSYGWHAAMDNRGSGARRSIILIYEKRTPERVNPKKFASIADLCQTPERQALFGLEG